MVPPEVLERLDAFAAHLDRRSPGTLRGVYTLGSVALGDYRPASSNIDALAVADRAWTPEERREARTATATLGRRHRPARVAFVTWDDLASDGPPASGCCYEGDVEVPVGELLNPLSGQVMRSAAICTRGPEYPELGDGDLRRWATDRLTGWWSDWLRRNRHRPGSLALRRATSEPVLEVTRLIVAVRSGRVVSKLEAGESSLDATTSRAARILKDATGYRTGSRTSMYWGPFERRSDAVAYIETVVREAAAA